MTEARKPGRPSQNGTIEALLESNRYLTEQVVELARMAFEVKKAEAAPAPVFLPTFSSEPMHESEEVEDAKWKYRNGLINKDALSEILEQAGFQNTHIDLS